MNHPLDAADKGKACGGMRECWEALGYAIAEHAVNEYRELESKGIVRNGEVVEQWPIDGIRKHKRIIGYKYHPQVEELISFFRDGAYEELLTMLGSSKINVQATLDALGIKEKQTCDKH